MLAHGRFWRASLQQDSVVLEIHKGMLPEDLQELRDTRFEVPLAKWGLLVKNVYSDRKRLGGLLLDYAKQKDRTSLVVSHDRLLAELRRAAIDATLALLEAGRLVLTPAEGQGEA